jgi:hypothetical protein
VPPGYERKKPVQWRKLGPWLGVIDQILVNDKPQPKKQRHTRAVQLMAAQDPVERLCTSSRSFLAGHETFRR